MTRSRKLSAFAGVSVLVLAACGAGPVGDAAVQFGQSFTQAFRATDRAEPLEPASITYLRVSDTDEARRLTQEPINF